MRTGKAVNAADLYIAHVRLPLCMHAASVAGMASVLADAWPWFELDPTVSNVGSSSKRPAVLALSDVALTVSAAVRQDKGGEREGGKGERRGLEPTMVPPRLYPAWC
eukprot:438991-Rhodomonas_salina.1